MGLFMRQLTNLLSSFGICLFLIAAAAEPFEEIWPEMSEVGGTWTANPGDQGEFFARLTTEDEGNISLRIWTGTTTAPAAGKRPAFENLDIFAPMLMQFGRPEDVPTELFEGAPDEGSDEYRLDLTIVEHESGNVLRITNAAAGLYFVLDIQFSKNQYKVVRYALRYPVEDGATMAIMTCDLDFQAGVQTLNGVETPLRKPRDVDARRWTPAAPFLEPGDCGMS